MEFRTLPHETVNENFKMLAKGMSGDMVFKLSQTTAAPTAAQCAAADQVYDIGIRLESATGELHSWYNGKVLIAIADDDSTGVATISPAGGEVAMTNGQLTVTVTLPKAVWTASKKATFTVSGLATAGTGIGGFTMTAKTFVATVAA